MVVFAVVAMSWGAVFFALMAAVPAATKSHWRLTLMAVMQTPGFARDFARMDEATRARWVRTLPLLAATGVVLALHFVAFAWGLDHTAFAVANVLVSTPPLMFVSASVAVWAWARAMASAPRPADADAPSAAPGAAPGGVAPSAPSAPPLFKRASASLLASSRALLGGQGVAAAWRAGRRTPPPPPPVAPLYVDAVIDGGGGSGDGSEAWGGGGDGGGTSTARVDDATRGGRCAAALVWRWPKPPPPTRLELLGALLAFAGVVVLMVLRGVLPAFDAADGAPSPSALVREHSLAGDAAELVAAVLIAVYLAVGRRVRAWCPLWAYVFPITACAAVAAGVVAVAMDGADPVGVHPAALLGWTSRPDLFGLSLGAALVPGILGHTLVNLALKRVHPLVVSTTQLLQPLLSGAFGFAVGVQGVPSPATLLACPVILAGIACTILGSRSSPLHGRGGGGCSAAPDLCGACAGRRGQQRLVDGPGGG